MLRLDATHRVGDLVLPVAACEESRLSFRGNREDARFERGRLAVVEPDFLDAGQERVHALVPARRELGLGGHDVDRLDRGQPCHEVEVGRPEAARLERPVTHRDDQAPVRRWRRIGEATLSSAACSARSATGST